MRFRIAITIVWVASLLAVGALAREQAHSFSPLPGGPVVVSGDDIGFRIEGTLGGAPAGTVVIRRNGEWVEPAWKPAFRPTR